MLNEKAKRIWIGYNKGIVNYSYDFALEKMSFDLFEDTSSNFCWTIFNLEGNNWIPINCSTMKKIPNYIEIDEKFFIDGDQYRFKKTTRGYDVLKQNFYYDNITDVFDIEKSIKRELGYKYTTEEFELEKEKRRQEYKNKNLPEQVISLIGTTINPDDESNNRFIKPSEVLDLLNEAKILEDSRKQEEVKKIDPILDSKTVFSADESTSNIIQEDFSEEEEIKRRFIEKTTLLETRMENLLNSVKTQQQKEKQLLDDLNKKLEEKKKNLIYYEYWELVYGNSEIAAKDFAGEIIIKDEFRTNSKYSWDIDFFDPERIDQEKYIASSAAIKVRNRQTTFVFKNSTYNVIKINDKYKIIDPNEVKNVLKTPHLLAKKIDDYFHDKNLVTVPYTSISSILISFLDFPELHLERMRALLYSLFNELDVFLDIFIYKDLVDKENNKTSIRIFFRGSNYWHYSTIFDVSLIARKAITLSILKIMKNNPSLKIINFDILLQNHLLKFPYVSWFTNFQIEEQNKSIIKPNNKFIIDEFYYSVFTKNKGSIASVLFQPLKIVGKNYYLCNQNYDNMIKYASELSFSSKK